MSFVLVAVVAVDEDQLTEGREGDAAQAGAGAGGDVIRPVTVIRLLP